MLPDCGLYKTTRAVAGVAAGRLVYFHNHGEPGPGLYLPSGWALNRALWQPKGFTLAHPDAEVATLEALPAEGLYSVREPFFCCEKQCTRFERSQLVQLGYDAEANAILFVPELTDRGLGFPERGTRLEGQKFAKLERLVVARSNDLPREGFVH